MCVGCAGWAERAAGQSHFFLLCSALAKNSQTFLLPLIRTARIMTDWPISYSVYSLDPGSTTENYSKAKKKDSYSVFLLFVTQPNREKFATF